MWPKKLQKKKEGKKDVTNDQSLNEISAPKGEQSQTEKDTGKWSVGMGESAESPQGDGEGRPRQLSPDMRAPGQTGAGQQVLEAVSEDDDQVVVVSFLLYKMGLNLETSPAP